MSQASDMNPLRWSRHVISTWILLLLAIGPKAVGAAPDPEPFTFAALGCMPYARGSGSGPAFAQVIAEINRHRPAFTVHLGDILSSDEHCTDELLLRRRADFNTFSTALIYTPGDNEWTD